ncbi:bifunctional sugar phosphate isomerase/epimerase/4-hydroxyphenylpyruvate dioxygenase family protein [Mycetocola zhujimingii]|uniref:bifunctional sugar phosphate isomerase/epimerase/4-hydroxyphenylpyruvate dioxygenase family protein n=1 Tax=Mycetocola zhujimingii TaxID=2079792 RepID=UPI000D3B8575|nr:sugar phosphate isomerase/epimerase and 4-hydroxyphenylpyruvate domain-containing protein [Mycetocola zhujimingii]AWB85390.1 4-hydroxyphenylpyruvate dioxygenase [Mycetocola zhujimingii]
MRTSIATVCLSGTLDQKLAAASEAGFDGVEIFEPDLIASPESPEAIRARADELGLSLDLYQPFRDFEGVGPDLLEHNLRRAGAKFSLMNRLGIETMLLCSNVATARSGDEQLAATQLRELGELAERFGVRVAYEALAWGRFVDDYEQAARIVRLADHPRIGVCLDSFHILSRGHDPQAIETIPADKIFFVQLADAPILSMDVLSWSRHHRLFPGEGGFDLAAFMGHLVRTGYDGPISLEIFNDTFRQSDAASTAVDARRSLRLLEDETRAWLGRSSRGRTEQMTARPLPVVEPPADINYVELRTDAIDEMRTLLAQLGFAAHGRHRTKSVELWSQGAARMVLGRPETQPPPPTVAGIGLSVSNPDAALRRATDLFAPEIHRSEGPGDESLVGVRAPDGSEVFFGLEGSTEPKWVREFPVPDQPGAELVERVDHINLAQPWQHFDAGVLFFHSVLDLRSQPSMEVAAPVGLVRSQVLRAADGVVRIALNLVPSGAHDDAILPQHIAFASTDVLALARQARERGFHPLDIPANYYDDIEARFDIEASLLAELKELNVMYDRDEAGEFLHFYTQAIGTVFLEVVERRDGYEGYGALNAPVRLAAQYQQRRDAEGVPA